MTEAEWQVSGDTWRMLHAVRRSPPTERKRLLLTSSMCRLIWDYLPSGSKLIVEECELLADGLVSVTAKELCHRANRCVPPIGLDGKSSHEREAAVAVCYAVLEGELFVAANTVRQISANDPRAAIRIRDIFGNPFRPVSINPDWLTSSVLALAEGIYADRAFDRMPVLADALQDAGCENADILNHCRGDGPHVRGCWIVDLLTGRE
jgi:hypothetical protein